MMTVMATKTKNKKKHKENKNECFKTTKKHIVQKTCFYITRPPPNITDLLRDNHPEIPGGIGVGQITRDIVLLLIYSFTFTSAFMQ